MPKTAPTTISRLEMFELLAGFEFYDDHTIADAHASYEAVADLLVTVSEDGEDADPVKFDAHHGYAYLISMRYGGFEVACIRPDGSPALTEPIRVPEPRDVVRLVTLDMWAFYPLRQDIVAEWDATDRDPTQLTSIAQRIEDEWFAE